MEALYSLALLACPVGMGVMMWFMMRGNRQKQPQRDPTGMSANELRAEHECLGAEVQRAAAREEVGT